MRTNKIPVCRECKSDDVVVDAWASWNPEDKKWEVESTFDNAHCNNCDGETKIEWVKPEAVKHYDEDLDPVEEKA